MVKHLPTMQETWVWSLGWEDPLEKEMATHFSTLAWKIPWMEEPGRLQFVGLQWVGHDWGTSLSTLSIESVIPSKHLVLCHPLLLLPSIFPSIRVVSNESARPIRWPNIGVSASASVLPMKVQGWFPLGLIGWISLQSKGLSGVFFIMAIQKHQFSGIQASSGFTLTSFMTNGKTRALTTYGPLLANNASGF